MSSFKKGTSLIVSVVFVVACAFGSGTTAFSKKSVQRERPSSSVSTIISECCYDLVSEQSSHDCPPENVDEKKVKELAFDLYNKENPCLVGRQRDCEAVVKALAWELAHGKAPKKIKNWRIIAIDDSSYVRTDTPPKYNMEEVLEAVRKYMAANKNVVLFVDRIERFDSYAQFCKDLFGKGELKIVTTATPRQFETYSKRDPAFVHYFLSGLFVGNKGE